MDRRTALAALGYVASRAAPHGRALAVLPAARRYGRAFAVDTVRSVAHRRCAVGPRPPKRAVAATCRRTDTVAGARHTFIQAQDCSADARKGRQASHVAARAGGTAQQVRATGRRTFSACHPHVSVVVLRRVVAAQHRKHLGSLRHGLDGHEVRPQARSRWPRRMGRHRRPLNCNITQGAGSCQYLLAGARTNGSEVH